MNITDNPQPTQPTDIWVQVEMHMDSVQSLEYTITNPLLSATAVAAICANIPTGMVQWIFVCLLASHLLCIPILYMTHHLAKVEAGNVKPEFDSLRLSILMFLLCFIALQVLAITVKMTYIVDTMDYYEMQGLVSVVVWFLFAMQICFMVTVILYTVPVLLGMGDGYSMTRMMGEYSEYAYTIINLVIKLVIGCMLASAANSQHFPVFSCDIWEGKYASPNPIK